MTDTRLTSHDLNILSFIYPALLAKEPTTPTGYKG
jgi:hypothetical protein